MLLGEQCVGKSSLADSLVCGRPATRPADDRTVGIEVRRWWLGAGQGKEDDNKGKTLKKNVLVLPFTAVLKYLTHEIVELIGERSRKVIGEGKDEDEDEDEDRGEWAADGLLQIFIHLCELRG